LPAGAQLVELPPIVVGEHCLNDAQVTAVLAALGQSTLAQPHPLVAALKAHAEPVALNAFAWKLLELWEIGGAPAKEKWPLLAVGLLGGDAAALKLAPLLCTWPDEGQNAHAVLGVECLRAIGTDTALMQIGHVAQTIRAKGAQYKKL